MNVGFCDHFTSALLPEAIIQLKVDATVQSAASIPIAQMAHFMNYSPCIHEDTVSYPSISQMYLLQHSCTFNDGKIKVANTICNVLSKFVRKQCALNFTSRRFISAFRCVKGKRFNARASNVFNFGAINRQLEWCIIDKTLIELD